jgi:hypothetical protein
MFEIAIRPFGTLQGDLEDRLEGGLVEAGEAAAGARRLELRGRQDSLRAVGPRVSRLVEAAHFLAQLAGEADRDGRGTRGSGCFAASVTRSRAASGRISSAAPSQARVGDLEVRGVEHDLLRRRLHLELDRHLALERQGVEVGLEGRR